MIYDLKNGYYVRNLLKKDLDGPYMSWFEDQDVCKFNSHGKFFKNENIELSIYSKRNTNNNKNNKY